MQRDETWLAELSEQADAGLKPAGARDAAPREAPAVADAAACDGLEEQLLMADHYAEGRAPGTEPIAGARTHTKRRSLVAWVHGVRHRLLID